MGKVEDRREYIVAQANQTRAELGIKLGDVMGAEDLGQVRAVVGHRGYMVAIEAIVRRCSDEHLGKIVCASPPLAGNYPSLTNLNGRLLSEIVASDGLVTTIAGILWAEVQAAKAGVAPKEFSKQAQFNLWLEEGRRFIDHCRSGVGGHWYFNSVQNEGLQVVVRCQLRESAREIESRIGLLKGKIASWVPAHKELTIVVEVVGAVDGPQQKAAVFFSHTCGGTQ